MSSFFAYVPEVGETFAPMLLRDLCDKGHIRETDAERYLSGRPIEVKDETSLAAMREHYQHMENTLRRLGAVSYIRTDEPVIKSQAQAKVEQAAVNQPTSEEG